MESESKVFDWKECERKRSPDVYQYLWETHNKFITEDEFVASFPRKEKGNNKNRCHSSARYQYKRLQKNFGFFKGQQ